MSANTQRRSCGHAGCDCEARDDDRHCSEYCKAAANGAVHGLCECGHAECGAQVPDRPESLEVMETPFTKFAG
jgi:hypothetical protein